MYSRLHPTRWYAPTWYEQNPHRLLIEKQVMATRFPQFQLFQDGSQLVWQGSLQTNRNNTYKIAVYYPDNFPDNPPKVYPIEPEITVWKDEQAGYLKHQYNDGRLCLFYPHDRTVGPQTTAAVIIGIAAAWFFAYETWLESGKTEWPGDAAD